MTYYNKSADKKIKNSRILKNINGYFFFGILLQLFWYISFVKKS